MARVRNTTVPPKELDRLAYVYLYSDYDASD